jgi:hypothetical protein
MYEIRGTGEHIEMLGPYKCSLKINKSFDGGIVLEHNNDYGKSTTAVTSLLNPTSAYQYMLAAKNKSLVAELRKRYPEVCI